MEVDVRTLLTQLLFATPMILVSLGALGFAASRFEAHKRISMFVIAAFVAQLLAIAISMTLQGWITAAVGAGYSMSTVGQVSSIVGLVRSGLHVASIILLTVAAFADRGS